MVAYSGVARWDSWLSIEKLGRQSLDTFSDLRQSDPLCIKYQAVSEGAALKVRVDGVYGSVAGRPAMSSES